MSQETFNTQFNFSGFNTLKKDLREATELYQRMLQSGTATTAQIEEQARKVAELRDEIDDANEATAALTGAGRIQAFTRGLTAVAGGFQAVQGAIALSGVESEKLQATMVKLQAAMALTQGLAALEDLPNAMRNVARATGLATVAMRAYTFVTSGATVATKALRAALISLGAGAVLVGVGLLIEKLLSLGGAAEEAGEKAKEMNQKINDTNKETISTSSRVIGAYRKETEFLMRLIQNDIKKGNKDVLLGISEDAQNAGGFIMKTLKLSREEVKKFFEQREIAEGQQLEELRRQYEIDIQNLEPEVKKAEAALKRAQSEYKVYKDNFDRGQIALGTRQEQEARLKVLEDEVTEKNLTNIDLTNQLTNKTIDLADVTERILTNSLDYEGMVQQVYDQMDGKIKERTENANKRLQEDRKNFQENLKTQQDSLKNGFEQEAKLRELNQREKETTIKDERELQESQFRFNQQTRLKELENEKIFLEETLKQYQERNKKKDISDEERLENQKIISGIEEDLAKLKILTDREIEVSAKELAEFLLRLMRERAQEEMDLQDQVFENFKKNYQSQQEVIDAFYNNRRLAALREIKDERKQQRALDKIQLESLEKRIKNAQFLGQSTLELEKQRSDLTRKMIKEDAEYQAATFQATLQIGQALFQGLINLDNIRLQNSLRNENLSNQQKEQIARESFERQKALNISMALMDAAMTVSSIYAQFPKFDGGFMMYAALALAAVQLGMALAQIQATEFVPPSTSSSNIGQGVAGSKFQEGGLIMGPGHSQGGIKTLRGELEGGEFVMNRISSQAFLPLLEQMNAMGNSNSQRMMNPAQSSTPIIKTYVVANDMYSELEKRKKIQKLARL